MRCELITDHLTTWHPFQWLRPNYCISCAPQHIIPYWRDILGAQYITLICGKEPHITKPKLLDEVRRVARLRHLSRHTGDARVHFIKRLSLPLALA